MNYENFEALIVKDKDISLIKDTKDTGILQVFLGVTVKSITEHETDGILYLAYTLTIKMVESLHNEMYINVNKEGDNIPNYRNKKEKQSASKDKNADSFDGRVKSPTTNPIIYNDNAGSMLPDSSKKKDTPKLVTRSAHINSEVKCTSDCDFCPFIVSTYDLSIKLNSLDEDNIVRKKLKTVFVSRYLPDFIEFQAGAIGKGISKADFVSVVGVSKLKSHLKEINKDFENSRERLPEIGVTKHDGLWIDLNDEQYETDEIIIRFTTRSKQISNLVHVVLPCIIVPLIFGEISRRDSLNPKTLLTGVLTLIFAMPTEFGFGTALWFGFAFSLCAVTYIVNVPKFGICVELFSGVFGISLLIFFLFYHESFIVHQNIGGHMIANLTKDKDKNWRKLTLGERFCLV